MSAKSKDYEAKVTINLQQKNRTLFEVLKIETSKALGGEGHGRRYPVSSRLGGLRERRKLPRRVPGRELQPKMDLVHFDLERTRDDNEFVTGIRQLHFYMAVNWLISSYHTSN